MQKMKYSSQYKQLVLDLSWTSLEGLPKDNRWVKLGDSLPWDKIEQIYNNRLNNKHGGAGNKSARIIIGALLIKHKMNLSDRETIQAISENPYMQYMLGLSEFTPRPVFDPSLFVTIRKRLGEETFNDMSESLLKLEVKQAEEKAREQKEQENDDSDEKHGSNVATSVTDQQSPQQEGTSHQGILKVDATCSDAEMRFPTDLDLLHDGVEIVDRVITRLCKINKLPLPNTHLKEIHSKYLNVIKLRSKPKKKIKACMDYLLTKLYRNIVTFLNMAGKESNTLFNTLKPHDRQLFMTVLKMYHQQKDMFIKGVHQCDHRIVSIFQPHVRPIVRGKAKAKVEFGGKIGASIVKGYTFIDHHSWEAYNECDDLMRHLRNYKKRFGYLPKKFEGDKIYMNRTNRRILRLLKIEIGGKPLGRPSKDQLTKEYQMEMAKNVGERNEVEATFGTGKRVYNANDIRAKLSDTGKSWTAACYFAKNVMKFLRGLLHDLFGTLLFLMERGFNLVMFEFQNLMFAKNLILTNNRYL